MQVKEMNAEAVYAER